MITVKTVYVYVCASNAECKQTASETVTHAFCSFCNENSNSVHIKTQAEHRVSTYSEQHQLFINAPVDCTATGIDVSVMWTDTSPWSSPGCSRLMGRLDFTHCLRHFLNKTLQHTSLTHFIKTTVSFV